MSDIRDIALWIEYRYDLSTSTLRFETSTAVFPNFGAQELVNAAAREAVEIGRRKLAA